MTALPSRSKDNPWKLHTPPGTSAYTMHTDVKDGPMEAWGRSAANPVGGWYGLKKGLRGRFAVYVPPLMEALGLCELEHNARYNRMRVKGAK